MKVCKKIHIVDGLVLDSNFISKLAIEENLESKNILVSAQNRAKKLCEDSQSDYEQELERGYNEGKNKSDTEMLETMLLHSKQTIDHLITLEQKLINVVEKSLRKIIGEFEEADLIKKITSQHLHNLRVENSVTLKVHEETFSSVKDTFYLNPTLDKYLYIVPDNTIKDTDAFILESATGTIESSVSLQLDTLISSFKDNI